MGNVIGQIMLNIQVLCVGNIKEKFFTEEINEYSKRLSSFVKLEITELKEYKLNKENSQEIATALKSEAKEILSRKKGYTIALCIDGKQMPSEKLAHHIDNLCTSGVSQITFIIGSSYGLDKEVINSSDEKLSFSELTFPHQLMRVILLEQIYRSMTILNGKSYHK